MPEDRLITRDYLDARLDALRNQLLTNMTWGMIGLVGVLIVVIGLLDKFVWP